MKAFKINQVLSRYNIPIQNGATPRDKYPFLTSAPYNQYFTLNLSNYPQIIIVIKYSGIINGLVYQFNSISQEQLTQTKILQSGFLIPFDLYSQIKPYQVFYINSTLFLVSVSESIGYYQQLQQINQDNIKTLYQT
ncbi:hypothetical protein HpBT060_14740 [Helicobacter pylori]